MNAINAYEKNGNNSIIEVGREDTSRKLFDVPSIYDFFDDLCCSNISQSFLNPCPQISECYAAENCNKCCQGKFKAH